MDILRDGRYSCDLIFIALFVPNCRRPALLYQYRIAYLHLPYHGERIQPASCFWFRSISSRLFRHARILDTVIPPYCLVETVFGPIVVLRHFSLLCRIFNDHMVSRAENSEENYGIILVLYLSVKRSCEYINLRVSTLESVIYLAKRFYSKKSIATEETRVQV